MQRSKEVRVLEESTLAHMYRSHGIALLSYIRRYVSSREDAEDVLLEVFLAAQEHHSLTEMEEGEQLAWLRRVAYNKCIDLKRHQKRIQIVDLESVAEELYEPDEQAPEVVALRSEEHALLRGHLAALPPGQQTILHLKFGRRLSSVEIARQLNKSESGVSMTLSRALNRLREMYGRKKGDCDHA